MTTPEENHDTIDRDELCRAVKAMPTHAKRTRIDAMRAIVLSHQAATLEGMLVDATSAHAFVKVWEALSPDRRPQIETLPLPRVMAFVWKCFK